MRPFVRLLTSSLLVFAACRGQGAAEPAAPIEPSIRPLAQLAAQHVIVTPTHSLRVIDPLGWVPTAPKPRDLLRALDDDIATALGDRGLKSQWVYPPDLVRAMRSNPSYAIDPYALGASPLRNPAVVSGSQLGDPLATQLRTMIALQEGVRAVLMPVELRFDGDKASGKGLAILRVALVDGRLGDVRWIGDVKGDSAPAYSRAVITSLASRLADLIAAP